LFKFFVAFIRHLSWGVRNTGTVGSFVLGSGWVATEWFGCSFLGELGVIVELFTQLCLGRLCKAVHLLHFFYSPRRGPPPGLGPLGSCLGCLGRSPALAVSRGLYKGIIMHLTCPAHSHTHRSYQRSMVQRDARNKICLSNFFFSKNFNRYSVKVAKKH